MIGIWSLFISFVIVAVYVGLVQVIVADENKKVQENREIRVFLEWAFLNGVETDAVFWPIDFPGTGRGAIALRDIHDGDSYMKVPLSVIMMNSTAIGTEIEPVVREVEEFEGLLLVLLNEVMKDRESFYFPYLNILPPSYDTLLLWSGEELRELQYPNKLENVTTDLYLRIAQREDLLARLRRHGLDELANQISLPLYMWAHAAASTRCFELNGTVQYALVPFADLLNHHPESPTLWRQEEGKFFVMYVHGGGFEKGTQVYNNYGGEQSNWRMLSDYGFFRPDNEFNLEEFIVEFSDGKRAVWGGRNRVFLFWKIRPFLLLKFFRVVAADSVKLLSRFRYPNSLKSERKAALKCSEVILKYLQNLPTSLAEDYVHLFQAKQQQKRRKYMAILYRIERKKLLLRNAGFCERLVEKTILGCIPPYMIRSLKYYRLLKQSAQEVPLDQV